MSSVTHELRTPLTSIRALAELMADDPQMADRPAPAVHRHHRRRDRAPVAPGQPGAGPGEDRVRPRRMAQRRRRHGGAGAPGGAVDRPRCCASRARGSNSTCPSAVPTLRADPDRLTQVLLNLLGNAAKFVPRQDGLIQVRLRTDEAGLTRAGAGQRPRRAGRAGRARSSRSSTRAAMPPTARPAPAWGCRSAARSSNTSAAASACGMTSVKAPVSSSHYRGRHTTNRRELEAMSAQDPDRRRRTEHPDLARVPDEARRLRGAPGARRPGGAGQRCARERPRLLLLDVMMPQARPASRSARRCAPTSRCATR